jgi:6-phosphogluconate dehydrogenase
MKEYIKIIEDNSQPATYIVKVCLTKNPTKTSKQYIIDNLQDWCERKGVDHDTAVRAIKTGSPVKGAKNVYRLGINRR